MTTKIEWTEKTINVVTGCKQISAGCKNCYAIKMTRRLKGMGIEKYKKGFDVVFHEEAIKKIGVGNEKRIFLNSMSDTFNEEISNEQIFKMFNEMAYQCIRHNGKKVYQVLTKRATRMWLMDKMLPWAENIWMGVTVEDNISKPRIKLLRETGAKVKFISFEPLLEEIKKLDLRGIDWVIIGGETGPGARKMETKWAIEIRDLCIKEGIPLFFKSTGGNNSVKKSDLLEGRVWHEFPR